MRGKISGIIVPHAGWIYSGRTASLAYQLLNLIQPERIALLGPSHNYPINQIVADPNERWVTPIGNVDIIKDIYFTSNETYHRSEHSLEVQMPFVKFYSRKSRVLPLVIGQVSQDQAYYCAEHLLKHKYFLVISTDLSHFHSLPLANELDHRSISSIENLKEEDVEACGFYPLRVTFAYCRQKKVKPRLIDYSTSAGASGNRSNVVGYASFYF
jgi:AmmeMemoRadiSam system protein B